MKSLMDQASNSTIRIKRLTHDTTSDSQWRSIVDPLMKRGQAEVLLVAIEKLLCARAKTFFGSPISSFSVDIARIRHGLRTASCRDTTICEGEKEWVRNRG